MKLTGLCIAPLRLVAAAMVIALSSFNPAVAVEPEEQLANPAQESRARAVAKTLRCVVCQNQSIDDSDAQIARDMRKLLRDRILAGDSDAEIRELFVSYYGEFVLMQPRVSIENIFIWLAGPAALGVGAIVLWRRLRGGGGAETATAATKQNAPPQDALSEEEEQRLRKLLGDR